MSTLSFDCSAEDILTIKKIVDRAMALYRAHGVKRDRLDVHMDITACHCNGCPLRLDNLLQADEFNFMHDVGGIARHINRSNGQLEDCFLPRFYDSSAAVQG